VPDERYASYIKGSDFIRKHVFPGSSLVCLEAVRKALPKLGSLALRLDEGATLSMGVSYARTLRAWRVRFDAVEDQVKQLGFDDVFVRKWRYYLDYCEAGFACGHIDVKQIRLEKTDESLAVEATEGAHGSKPITLKDTAIKAVKGIATSAFERGLLPDFVTRYGIRQLSAQQLRHCDDAGRAANNGEAGLAGSQEKLRETIQALLEAPVAVCTSEANEQHYEVDARFYGLCLGPHRKYSACLYEGAEPKWPGNKLQKDAARLLPKAEKDSLDQVAARGDITQATKAILECGCGWGSFSLYAADRFRNAQVVGVSNSHSQRRYIMGQAQERGLTNLQIVTLDLSKEPLTKALDALQSRLPGQYFERGVSIEMFEHMKNYKALFEKITAVLEDQGRFFVHVFCHRQYAYHFVAKSDADWMAKYFFAGGTMPSADLFVHFAARKDAPVALVDHWRNSGVHYALTAEGWLQNMDANASEVREILKEAYPENETELWFHRWRAFYLACVELFGYDGGQEWCIGHYLFEKR
jgi:cyclopropane-fatty-acyl-phospholipid synthase